jgi:hypothetical protein
VSLAPTLRPAGGGDGAPRGPTGGTSSGCSSTGCCRSVPPAVTRTPASAVRHSPAGYQGRADRYGHGRWRQDRSAAAARCAALYGHVRRPTVGRHRHTCPHVLAAQHDACATSVLTSGHGGLRRGYVATDLSLRWDDVELRAAARRAAGSGPSSCGQRPVELRAAARRAAGSGPSSCGRRYVDRPQPRRPLPYWIRRPAQPACGTDSDVAHCHINQLRQTRRSYVWPTYGLREGASVGVAGTGGHGQRRTAHGGTASWDGPCLSENGDRTVDIVRPAAGYAAANNEFSPKGD